MLLLVLLVLITHRAPHSLLAAMQIDGVCSWCVSRCTVLIQVLHVFRATLCKRCVVTILSGARV